MAIAGLVEQGKTPAGSSAGCFTPVLGPESIEEKLQRGWKIPGESTQRSSARLGDYQVPGSQRMGTV